MVIGVPFFQNYDLLARTGKECHMETRRKHAEWSHDHLEEGHGFMPSKLLVNIFVSTLLR